MIFRIFLQISIHFYSTVFSTKLQDHVLIFSFILCVGVLRERGEIEDEVWNFFLSLQTMTGGVVNVDTDSLKLKHEPQGTVYSNSRFLMPFPLMLQEKICKIISIK